MLSLLQGCHFAEDYWESCKPAKSKKSKAAAPAKESKPSKAAKPEPKAKAKAKAAAKDGKKEEKPKAKAKAAPAKPETKTDDKAGKTSKQPKALNLKTCTVHKDQLILICVVECWHGVVIDDNAFQVKTINYAE